MSQECAIDFRALLADAVKAGLTPVEFWDATLPEVDAVLRSAVWREEQAQRHMLVMAWHVAALQRQKRLQSLSSLLRPRQQAKKVPIAERRHEFAELKAIYVNHRVGRSTDPDPGDAG